MLDTPSNHIKIELSKIVKDLFGLNIDSAKIIVEKPQNNHFGDYSSNLALNLAGKIKQKPLVIAEKIVESASKNSIFSKVEAAQPGFINFFLSPEYIAQQLKNLSTLLDKKKKFSAFSKKKKVNVEFISANPTGPLTLGNGRGGFFGDVLANLLEKTGRKATREYYINDYGEQITKLGHSVLGDDEQVYKGKYIEEIKKEIKGKDKKADKVGRLAADIILGKMIKPSIEKMGISFNVWFRESSLYKNKEIDKAVSLLRKKGLAYQKDGAIWFKSTAFGDDKDRVLIRGNGVPTYFLSDIAYLLNKRKRGFKELFFLWGADHYGYVGRMKAVIRALGFDENDFHFLIFQLVRLISDGKEVKMSKRMGAYVTIDELIDMVGVDVARYFFLTKSFGSHLDFDLALAKEKSEKNPVYYIQYAYARAESILKKAKEKKIKPKLGKRTDNSLSLEKEIIRLPEIISQTANDYQLQRLPLYAFSLAQSFHRFYTEKRVISGNPKISQERLFIVDLFAKSLKEVLTIIGISSPEKM